MDNDQFVDLWVKFKKAKIFIFIAITVIMLFVAFVVFGIQLWVD